MTHDLKTWPEFFERLWSGEKTFELRKNDRGFRVGHTLLLQEWTQRTGYAGREITAIVTYILGGLGLKDGWVVMAIKTIEKKRVKP